MRIEKIRKRLAGMTFSKFSCEGKRLLKQTVIAAAEYGIGYTILYFKEEEPQRFSNDEIISLYEGNAIVLPSGQIITLIAEKNRR